MPKLKQDTSLEDSSIKVEDASRSMDEFLKFLNSASQVETTSVESEQFDETAGKSQVTPMETDDKPTNKNKKPNTAAQDNGIAVVATTSNDSNESANSLVADLSKRRAYKLFKGMKNERVCQICEYPGKLIRCKGPCHSYFHLECVKPGHSSPEEPSEAGDLEENPAYAQDLEEIKSKVKEIKAAEDPFDDEDFRCIDCLSGIAPPCFVCHERESERIKCSVAACGKHYHVDCLKHWPQVQWHGDRLNCPYHVCHTCSSDDPQNGHSRATNESFVRCVRCPSTYHASISCLPAGSIIITASQIVCPKHPESQYPTVNATWCFICAKDENLICCNTCPMSFHLECLGIDAPEGDYICQDCENGRLPLYGEVVWVKLGTYRWWPSMICYPQEIPLNIAQKPHKTGEFCVMFLGTRDYYWVHRGRVFPYRSQFMIEKCITSRKRDEAYNKAKEEAKIIYEHLLIENSNSNAVNSEDESKGTFSEAFPIINKNVQFVLKTAETSLQNLTKEQTDTQIFCSAFVASTALKMCKAQLHVLNEDIASSKYYNFGDSSQILSLRDKLVNIIKKLDDNDEIKKVDSLNVSDFAE